VTDQKQHPDPSEEIKGQVWDLDFQIAKSIRYHAYRRSFWESCDYVSKILSVVSGASVIMSLLGENEPLAKVLAAVVAITSAADVVLGFGTKAKRHDRLYRDFSLLAMRLAELLNPTEADLAAIRRRRLEVEMEEPGIIDWLERRCAAEECARRGCAIPDMWKLTPWQVRLAQFAMWPSARSPAPASPR
jgi:hypothetical protein